LIGARDLLVLPIAATFIWREKAPAKEEQTGASALLDAA
jgi:hypothetical protein